MAGAAALARANAIIRPIAVSSINQVKDKRPVNLDIGTIALPITAIASILHRVSGVVLFFGSGILLWLLDLSLRSPEDFAQAAALLQTPLFLLLVWGVTAALLYHMCAGVRHLLMDLGIGESLEGGRRGALLMFVASAVLILLAGWYLQPW